MLPIGLCAQAACILEATARKPGNVHRFQDFEDLSYLDFILSAAAIAPIMEAAPGRGVGVTILESIQATRRVVSTNTNLGIVLLLAPLAALPRGEELRAGIERILSNLSREDARLAYQAIRLATPGGMGKVPEQDIQSEPTGTLREVMALAADRDSIARQYANGFREVLDEGLSILNDCVPRLGLENGIIHCHLSLMASHPDSLIARKWGAEVAAEASARAGVVLERGGIATESGKVALAELDNWLRQGRNPGTTADLVTASLFAALRGGTIQLPTRF
jgi:triphosphoribosyl-dephospho-CoA synthase